MSYRIESVSFKAALNKALVGVGNDLQNELVRVAPVDTGFLRNFINYSVEDGTITFNFPFYALYVEMGTPPHIIEAKDANALHWRGKDGSDHFAKRVHHPGCAPQPFIRATFHNHLVKAIKRNLEGMRFNVIVSS